MGNRGDFSCHKKENLTLNVLNVEEMQPFLLNLKQKSQFTAIYVFQNEFKTNKNLLN